MPATRYKRPDFRFDQSILKLNQRNRRITHNSIFAFSHSDFHFLRSTRRRTRRRTIRAKLSKKHLRLLPTHRAASAACIYVVRTDHPGLPGRSIERGLILPLPFSPSTKYFQLSWRRPPVKLQPACHFRGGSSFSPVSYRRQTEILKFLSTPAVSGERLVSSGTTP